MSTITDQDRADGWHRFTQIDKRGKNGFQEGGRGSFPASRPVRIASFLGAGNFFRSHFSPVNGLTVFQWVMVPLAVWFSVWVGVRVGDSDLVTGRNRVRGMVERPYVPPTEEDFRMVAAALARYDSQREALLGAMRHNRTLEDVRLMREIHAAEERGMMEGMGR